MSNNEAMETVDGALLSDLSVFHCYRNQTRASLAQQGREHIDWVVAVASALLELGVLAHCKIYEGTKYPGGYCFMHAGSCPLLHKLHDIWYDSGRKSVPRDLELTPVSVAHWFMGDGSSTWRSNLVLVKFSTQGFGPDDMDKLILCLDELGISPVHRNNCGKYQALYMGEIKAVNKLMDMIEPHILPSYRYKIKRPKLKRLIPA